MRFIALCLLALPFSPAIFAANSAAVESARTQIYLPAEVDRPPKLMLTFKTEYPPALQAEPVAGEVIVECVVDLDGVVRDPIVKSSTRKEFELPALQSVAKWKFRPGRKGNADVNVRLEIPVRFEVPKRRRAAHEQSSAAGSAHR